MKKNRLLLIISVISIIIISCATFLIINTLSLKLVGDKKISVKLNDEYVDAQAKACVNTLSKCEDITSKIKIIGNVDTSKIGTYKIKYKVKYGILSKTIVREVTVVDDEPPTITLKGNLEINICPNAQYEEEGYDVIDNYDKKIDVNISEENGKLIYTATDSSGNASKVYRTMNRIDKESPILKIENTIYIKQNDNYTDTFSATDNCDGDITNKVIKTGEVNTSEVGTYKINYEVTDESGNQTTATKKIIVYKINDPSNVSNKIIHLTFDDGPGQYTEYLLDILKKYNVQATFFVTAQYGHTNVMKRIVDEGHSIAIHSYTHNYNEIYQSADAFFYDLERMSNVIYDNTGQRTNLIRFPGGSSNMVSRFNPGIMTYLTKEVERRGYVYFDWNIDSMDTSVYDSETIKNNVINNLGNGSYVVLQHDIKQASVNAVEGIIQYGLANGYTFLPLNANSYTAHHHINN